MLTMQANAVGLFGQAGFLVLGLAAGFVRLLLGGVGSCVDATTDEPASCLRNCSLEGAPESSG